MGFHYIYYYPTKENPEFEVEPTKDRKGYNFTFYNQPPDSNLNFTINVDTVENRYEATGYTGKQGEAIETFRKFLFRFQK